MDGGQRNCIRLGCLPFRTSPGSGCFLSQPLSPWFMGELKRDHFYGRLPKWLKVIVAYLRAGLQVRTYSDYLRATQEAEKEDSMEFPPGPRTQATNTPPPNQGLPVSFPWGNSRATSPSQKHPTVHLVHLEEEHAGGNEDQESDNPTGIKGVVEECMVFLARAIKDAQVDEKHCYASSITACLWKLWGKRNS